MIALLVGFLFNVAACAVNVVLYVNDASRSLNLFAAIFCGACALWLGFLASREYGA